MIEITNRADQIQFKIKAGHERNWLRRTPDIWVTTIMTAFRACATSILDYREFRKGLINTAAHCLVALNFGDQMFAEKLKPSITDEERIMKFPGEHLS